MNKVDWEVHDLEDDWDQEQTQSCPEEDSQNNWTGLEEWEDKKNVIRMYPMPSSVTSRIELELLEVNHTLGYKGQLEPADETVPHFSLTVALHVDNLNLSDTHRRILGIVQPYIAVEYKFEKAMYWNAIPDVISVMQCSDFSERTPFALSWSSRQRMKTLWCKPWIQSGAPYPLSAEDILYVMDASQHSFGDAIHALKKSKFSSYDAIVWLASNSQPQTHNLPMSCNVYIQMLTALAHYIQCAHTTCMVCATKLENAGTKPSVCDKDLCCYAFENLGLGLDFNAELIRDAPILDLYITLFVAASKRNRLQFIQLESHDAFGKDTKLTSSEMCSILCAHCPSIDSLKSMAMNGQCVSRVLADIHPKLHSILRWLITTSRSYLRSLEPSEQWAEMKTPHQFVLLTDTPEREKAFQALKQSEKSTYFAFHGSDTGNWFSILRTGLKNLSNTQYMTTGAVWGPGVYLAETSQMSSSYAVSSPAWPKSMFGENIQCMALCEVVGQAVDKSGSGIYVVPEDQRISTRYFFVFPSGGIPAASAKVLFSRNKPI